jgi:two-component system response regulator MprA
METIERPRVLVVEDDHDVARSVQQALGAVHMLTDHADTLAAAQALMDRRTYDLVILDLGLPDGSGLELAQSLRRDGTEIPILMLTAQAAVSQRVSGFAHGADDYVCKPFAVEELVARVHSLLRRTRSDRQHVLRYADVKLDLLKRTVSMGRDEIALSDREVALLAYLMRHAEQPLSRDTLAREVWGLDPEIDSGVVNVYVNYLRNKLERGDRHARLIHTVRGVGYMLLEGGPD